MFEATWPTSSSPGIVQGLLHTRVLWRRGELEGTLYRPRKSILRPQWIRSNTWRNARGTGRSRRAWTRSGGGEEKPAYQVYHRHSIPRYTQEDLSDLEQLVEELQEALYDQLTQYTKGELLPDIQIAGPGMSFESYRKAFAQGKKKTAENVHRARNRVSRPEIAESLEDLEAR